jgi:hypothetical protein
MTEDQKYEIAVLAEDYNNKRAYFDCLAMANVYGKTPEEALKLTINYHIAETEKMEALARLELAKAAITRQKA